MRIVVVAMVWAKLEKTEADNLGRKWLSLPDHSADVAAVFEAMLLVPLVARRLATLSGRCDFPQIWRSRISAHVALHDFGKANRGFQARREPKAPPIGHVGPALALLYAQDQPKLTARLFDILAAKQYAAWEAFEPAVRAVAAHHGRPITQKQIEHGYAHQLTTLWEARSDYDPIAALEPMTQAIREDWFPQAFEAGGEPLPEAPRFWHAVSGLVMLADWIGSNQAAFWLYETPDPDPMARITHAREIAPRLLEDYGFDPSSKRKSLPAVSFASVSKYSPRPIQEAVGKAEGQIVILEAETGSGKTEAALYRFARLFERGEVDGLYFALPTRVAAKSLEKRIRKAVRRIFRCSPRPAVILAVPGYARVDGISGKPLPDFDVQWDDDPDGGAKRARWAAEHPKRFLASTIAVGTIDQALLGAIQVRHAHMRASSLLRHLLVVDEVHASDVYMERLLTSLLDQHTRAGGHALLLSATLGSAARQRLLGQHGEMPSEEAAVEQPYPSVATSAASAPQLHTGSSRVKNVAIQVDPRIGDAAAIAQLALDAAEQGAKVLVIRNLRRAAIETAEALFALAPDHPALFRCEGVPTLHHGRFAREDRELLDGVIETQMRAGRGTSGLVLIGTQTLEQSLDICADFMITDLCPADVLLQRIGRLHRHEDNKRPTDFESTQLVVMSPPDLTALLSRDEFGMGPKYGPYRDLVMLEATRRSLTDPPMWQIPAMNRKLVESATHPAALEALTAKLEKQDPRWRQHREALDGSNLGDAYQAKHARLNWDQSFTDESFAFPTDERIGTRLGADDVLVSLPVKPKGPFGKEIHVLAIPARWLGGVDLSGELTPMIKSQVGALQITLGERTFLYDRLGLRLERK